MGRCNLMNKYILWLLVSPGGLWVLTGDDREYPSMHMGHSHLSPSRRGRVREKKLLKLEGKHISFDYTSWLNIQVYCYQNVLCVSEGGHHLLWHKSCQLPCTGSRSCRVTALPWLQGTHAAGTRTVLSHFGETEEHDTQRTTKLTNTPSNLFLLLKSSRKPLVKD